MVSLFLGYNAPQQVHITQGDHDGRGVIISWITPEESGSNWAVDSQIRKSADSIVVTYTYYNYTSGYIHHCSINNLEFRTKYYYALGTGKISSQFWFVSPPKPGPDVPYTFGLIVISSYSSYGKSTPQYKWITNELHKVNRTQTPWLIVIMH